MTFSETGTPSVLLLFFILGSYLQFFISPACDVAVSFSLPCALEPRRTSKVLQAELCSSPLGEEEDSATELGFHNFAAFLRVCIFLPLQMM